MQTQLCLKRPAIFWLIPGILAPVILLINPIREMALGDDWAYALTVKNLVETGSFKSIDWSTPSMPFQAYWGALFAHLLGYSFTSLRISTLVLMFLGLIAFYYLAREHRLDRFLAALLVLCLFSSPLVMEHSFSFNSDAPFLMCSIIAIALYTRAIRLENYVLMFLGSCCASSAVLTRQFGLALPASIFFLWALSKERKTKAGLFITGLFLPGIAGLWQLLASGLMQPSWAQRSMLYQQLLYFSNYRTMLSNIVWRPTATLHYLALFTLPLMAIALLGFVVESKQLFARYGTRRFLIENRQYILLAFSAYVLFGIIYGHSVNHLSVYIPYLPWDETLAAFGQIQRAGWTLVTSIGAVLYGYIFVQRYRTGWHETPTSERLLDLFTILIFAEHLVFLKFGDRYLLPLLPFAIVAVGRHVGSLLNRYAVPAFGVCVVMILVSAMWTRGILEQGEAMWKAAESVRRAGVEPPLIYSNYEWNFYNGMTDDYVADIGQSTLVKNYQDFWQRFARDRKRCAEFLITTSTARPGQQIVNETPYRDMFFHKRQMYVVEKTPCDPTP